MWDHHGDESEEKKYLICSCTQARDREVRESNRMGTEHFGRDRTAGPFGHHLIDDYTTGSQGEKAQEGFFTSYH